MPGRLHSNATLYQLQLSTYVGSYKDVLLLKRLLGQIDVSMVHVSKSPSLANLGVRYKSTCLNLRIWPRPVWLDLMGLKTNEVFPSSVFQLDETTT